MLLEESQVSRLGFFGLCNYSIPLREIQQVHSSLTQLYWNQPLAAAVDLLPVVSISSENRNTTDVFTILPPEKVTTLIPVFVTFLPVAAISLHSLLP